MHVFLLDCLLLVSLPLSHPSLSYSRQLFSAFDSVSASGFRRSSISAFSISVVSIVLVSRLSFSPLFYRLLVLRFRFRYPVVFISSPPSFSSFTSFRSRHPYNMSPIVTFLVSGLLLLFRRYVASILGFLAASPVPFVASCFSPGVQVGCCLPAGSKIPAKLLHFLFGRTSWLLPPSGLLKVQPNVTFYPPFRLGQPLCISPPIVHRPFEFPLPSVVFFTRISYPPISTSPLFSLSILRHTLLSSVFRFLVSLSFSRCRFLVVFLRNIPDFLPFVSPLFSIPPVSRLLFLSIPVLSSVVSPFTVWSPSLFSYFVSRIFPPLSSIPLVMLGHSRYRPSSPVFSPCRYQSCPPSFPPYSRPAFRLLVLRRLGYLLFIPRPLSYLFSSAHVLWFNPRQLFLSSLVSAFVSILANRSSRLNPSSTFISIFVPTNYASSSSFHSSFLVCCFDILSISPPNPVPSMPYVSPSPQPEPTSQSKPSLPPNSHDTSSPPVTAPIPIIWSSALYPLRKADLLSPASPITFIQPAIKPSVSPAQPFSVES